MAAIPSTYHAPTFEPTLDELETLKQLEMGRPVGVPEALKHHLSGRLLHWGMVTQAAGGDWHITEAGRQIIKRQNN